MSTMTVASFAQNGRGFTQIARNLVLDGKWRDASPEHRYYFYIGEK